MLGKHPFFSVIIPTYTRPDQLAICLEAVAKLDYPRDRFEVIVVDDGSPQPLNIIVNSVYPPIDITLIRQENQGPARARNLGAERARGTFLAFTDDDCAPDPNWLKVLAEGLSGHPHYLVGGQIDNAMTNNMYASVSQLLISYIYEFDIRNYGSPKFFTTNNFALSRELFLNNGGFDTSFPLAAGEDRDFCDRWRRAGHKLLFLPEARVYHYQSIGALAFCRQHFRYGLGNFHFHKQKLLRGGGGIHLAYRGFYTGLLSIAFKKDTAAGAGRMTILLMLSQVANVVGFLSAWARDIVRTKSK